MMASVVAGLLVAVPVVVFVAMLAVGQGVLGAPIFVVVFFLAIGGYVWFDLLRQSSGGDRLAEFGRANHLIIVRSVFVPHYAGSTFGAGRASVLRSVRTRDPHFLEVGDRLPATAPRARLMQPSGRAQVEPHQAEVFLRARLAGRVAKRTTSERDVVPPEVLGDLARFAGRYTVEVTGDELTVFGSRPLGPTTPGRVHEAFSLTAALANHVNQTLVTEPAADPRPSEDADQRAPRRGPLATILVTLALLILGPLLIAVVMANLGDRIDNRGAAIVIVGVLIAVLFAVIGGLLRWLNAPGRRGSGTT
ncbi:hypothetical protein [Serinicoccus kebangsaanensis]|uniref:hypothetical protein n=1 Tax=Serinicoccus kebangsaanensis TaxID=2602069 RepID=UPI00124BEED7|nr:hypothetical protein [Serinicoccus kebangsaanensis]